MLTHECPHMPEVLVSPPQSPFYVQIVLNVENILSEMDRGLCSWK